MFSTRLIGSILIIISIAIAALGFQKINENTKEVEILGLEIEASNNSGQQQGYLYLGVAAAMFVGGIIAITKAKK